MRLLHLFLKLSIISSAVNTWTGLYKCFSNRFVLFNVDLIETVYWTYSLMSQVLSQLLCLYKKKSINYHICSFVWGFTFQLTIFWSCWDSCLGLTRTNGDELSYLCSPQQSWICRLEQLSILFHQWMKWTDKYNHGKQYTVNELEHW